VTATAPVTVADLSPDVPGYEIAAATHIGPVRQENQDDFAVTALRGQPGVAALVADGMGGLPGGGEAAHEAVAAMVAAVVTDGGVADLEGAMAAANTAVDRLRRRIGGHPGTTLTAVVIRGLGATVVHAGDSRAYLVREGVASPVTSDQSWVGEQVRSGALPPGSERRHPRRNVITSAVMGDPLTPELVELTLRPGDILMLCSDGFWEPLEDSQIAELLDTPGPLTAVVGRAAEAALDAGGTDNVTLLAVRIAS
jgi:serine/threonine protein phosphatase PrpC